MSKQRGLAVTPESNDYIPGVGINYLLAIGIDKYRNWEPLHNAVLDAHTFADLLLRQYQFESEHVHTLFDEQATEAGIYDKIRELKRKITSQDNLLIYYSGHGHYDEDFAEGHWVPVEAQTNQEDAYISNSDIIKRINAIDSHHTLLIVDSCFSGTLVVQNRNASVDERFASRRILASGRNETVSDGVQGQHSPFADGLITYLRKNTSAELRTTHLIEYIKDQVALHSRQSPVEGRIPNSADKGGEFVFHLRRDEDEYWQEITQLDTVKVYRDYQVAFPAGKYSTQAERRLTALREDEIWQTAQRNDNETAYDNYLKKYAPAGQFVAQARTRLDALRQERQEREQIREEIADRENQREQIRQQYQQLVEEAEQMFNARNLTAARDKYQQASSIFLPGFVPKLDYLEEQTNLCKTNMEFLRHYDRGKQAADSGNHRLAVQFFQEALRLHENAQVEGLLKHSQAQLQRRPAPPPERNRDRDFGRQTVVNRRQQQPRKISTKKWVFSIVFGLVICLLILIAIGNSIDEPYDYVPDPEDTDQTNIYSDQDDSAANTPALTIQQLIVGSWIADDVLVNGTSVNQLGQPGLTDMSFLFQNNNIVMVHSAMLGSQTYNYQLSGQQISISDPQYAPGLINQIDDFTLIFTLPFSQDGGYTFVNMTYQLSRE